LSLYTFEQMLTNIADMSLVEANNDIVESCAVGPLGYRFSGDWSRTYSRVNISTLSIDVDRNGDTQLLSTTPY
jgi:hypothetical protein